MVRQTSGGWRAASRPIAYGSAGSRCLEFQDFTVTRLEFAPGVGLESHTHEHTVIGCVIDGAIETRMGRSTHDCASGRIHVQPAGELHSNRFSGTGADVVVLTCDLSAPRFEEIASAIEDCRGVAENRTAARVGNRLGDELRGRDALTPAMVEGLALQLVAETVRRAHPVLRVDQAPSWLKQARELMHDRFTGSPTVGAIADEVGVHPMTLTRASARFLGATPGVYMRKLRVRRAIERLCGSRDSISTIAIQTGFSDQSHLTRAVKAATGHTPAVLRNSAHE